MTALQDPASQPARQGRCELCGAWAHPAVVIGEVHGDAGPGWTEYAHETCARQTGRPVVEPT